MDKHIITLLRFMLAHEADEQHKKFFFFNGIYERGVTKVDNTGNPI